MNPQWNEDSNQGGTIWNNSVSQNYKVESASETSMNSWLDNFLDPTGLVSGFWNDLTGITSQSREFAQQEYLMDKQNAYNHPAAQMQRMKDAGINPITAAAGISQGGNESAQAPQVSSNTQGASAGLSALAGMAGTIGQIAQVGSQIKKNNAEAEQAFAGAVRSNTLLPFDTALSLENIGLTRANAQAVAIENYYRPTSLMLDISQKRLTLPILRKQFDVLDSEYQVNMKSIDKMIQDIEESKRRVGLMDYTAQMQAALTQKYQAEADLTNRKFQLLRDLNWDVSTGIGGLLAGYAVYDGVDGLEANLGKLQDRLFELNYWESRGESIGSLDAKRALILSQNQSDKSLARLQAELDKDINKENRKGKFWNDLAGKWVRVPSSASVGPFKMSTE